jgi:hypothetical protein
MIHHGNNRLGTVGFAQAVREHDVIITSFGTARRDIEMLQRGPGAISFSTKHRTSKIRAPSKARQCAQSTSPPHCADEYAGGKSPLGIVEHSRFPQSAISKALSASANAM